LNLVKPSPTKRIPIDNNVKVKEDTKHTKASTSTKDIPSMTKTSNKTQSKSLTSESINKHGVIYNTEQLPLTSEHEDIIDSVRNSSGIVLYVLQ